METPGAKSACVESIKNSVGAWPRRHRTWQALFLCVCFIILSTTRLPQASADLTNETAVLIGIKKAWGNPSALVTWAPQFNTCSQWEYVICNAQNTTIIEINAEGSANVRSPLPMSIGALVNLEYLLLDKLGLTGEIPSTIGLLKNLLGLNLGQNVLIGSIPSEIGNLTKLQSLTLSNNNLTSTLPDSLSELRNLDYLDLSANQFSGSLPSWIGDFPLLNGLHLGNNVFKGTIPPSFGNLTNLGILDMTSAWAYPAGPLPTELGKLKSLTEMSLAENAFEGNIPPSFGNLIALISLDLSSCSLDGPIPSSLGNLSSLKTLSLDQNQLNGTIPTQLSQLLNLTALYLDTNSLTGLIPTQFGLLSNLGSLDLSSNFLSGEIPPKLVTLPDLQFLHLQDNCLSGPIPAYNKSELLNSNFGTSVDSNCFNPDQVCKCGGAPSPQPSTPAVIAGGSSSTSVESLYIGLGVGLGSLLSILGLLFLFCWRHNHRQRKSLNEATSLYKGPVRAYTFSQVKEATNNFSTKVGEGAYSTVYKATFEDGVVAGVKRFNKRKPMESFEQEVELIGKLNHRFLLNLVGYCEDFDAREHMLLYEFMDRGNLHENLHGRRGFSPLTWEERKRVIISVGYGIEYLHFGTNPPLIHRDIKSANILLSSSGSTLNAKLADFGLGRQTEVDADIMTATFGSEPPKAFLTRVAGTPGYFDPEYIFTSRLTNKTDVFSYGVVLLELITGKTPLLEERSTLANWAQPFLISEDIGNIIDPKLEKGTFDEEELRAVAEMARRCTENNSNDRPTIKEVMALFIEAFGVESKMANLLQRMSSMGIVNLLERTSSIEMVNLSERTSSIDFSDSNSTVDSQHRVLPGMSPCENSMIYTESEILPRD